MMDVERYLAGAKCCVEIEGQCDQCPIQDECHCELWPRAFIKAVEQCKGELVMPNVKQAIPMQCDPTSQCPCSQPCEPIKPEPMVSVKAIVEAWEYYGYECDTDEERVSYFDKWLNKQEAANETMDTAQTSRRMRGHGADR